MKRRFFAEWLKIIATSSTTTFCAYSVPDKKMPHSFMG
jgi:hypothetical protein